MKKSLIILAALVAPTLSFAQDGPRPVSLPEALDLAKKNAPQMIASRGTLRTNAAALKAARWALLPSLGVSYSSGTSRGGTYVNDQLVAQGNKDFSFSRSVSGLSLTLWDGGTKMGNVRSAEANIDAAEASEVATQYSIAQQVKTQYYSILQARETEANAQATLEQAEYQLQLAQARVRGGTAIAADTLTTFIAVQNARLSILNARNQQNTANAWLTRLAGSPYQITAIVSDTADPPPLSMSDADLFALADRGPGVMQSTAQLRAAEISEKTSKARYWPQITLGGSFSQNNRDAEYDFGQGKMNYSYGLSLGASYQIWDGYSRESGVIRAKVAADNADANLREQRYLVRQNLTQQIGNLRTAEETIRIQRLSIIAGQEALRIATIRYERGAGLLLEVITAQTTLNNSRTSLSTARVNARNARAQIESIIGRDLPQ
jgi:outer membrane protein